MRRMFLNAEIAEDVGFYVLCDLCELCVKYPAYHLHPVRIQLDDLPPHPPDSLQIEHHHPVRINMHILKLDPRLGNDPVMSAKRRRP